MSQISDILDQVPGAFLPELLRGQLAEAEHFARYWWLGQAVRGRRVLDAGCGVAHGTNMLAEAGATQVVGVDHRAALLEAAPACHPAVVLEHADACSLDHEDSSFGVVVAFGLFEQVLRARTILSELLRVLAPEGVIAVAVSPTALPPSYIDDSEGDGSSLRISSAQTLAEALEAMIARRCRSHVVLHQRNWMTSAILDEPDSFSSHGAPLQGIELRKIVAPASRSEIATIVVGSNGSLPVMHGTAVITHEFAQHRWLERCELLERKLQERAGLDRVLEEACHERQLLSERVHELEQEIAAAKTDDLGC